MIAAWTVGGLYALFGALAVAELATMLEAPHPFLDDKQPGAVVFSIDKQHSVPGAEPTPT